jgi:hypothetical protein
MKRSCPFELIMLLLAYPSPAFAGDVRDRPTEIAVVSEFAFEMPARFLPQLTRAFQDFRKVNKDWACYKVYADEDETGHLHVGFISPPEIVISAGEIIVTRGGGGRCGEFLTYEFDDRGKFVRKYGSR